LPKSFDTSLSVDNILHTQPISTDIESWVTVKEPIETPTTLLQEPKSCAENKRLLALLYSLTTPQNNSSYNFGTDIERICIDTGASACISTHRENFVTFMPVTKTRVNGIGSGLLVEGSGLLKWPIHRVTILYVPKAPIGLLCPQQIAQQTGKSQVGFNALGLHGILTFDGFRRSLS
jgi:hypothetical protein